MADDGAPPLPLATYRALVEHSSDIVTILEADSHWRISSPSGTRILGWPAGWDPGPEGIFALLHPDDVPLAESALKEVFAGIRGPDDPVVLRARATDGRWLTFETRARDLTDDPDIRGIVITARDITEKRVAERRVARLHDVLESSSELVVLCLSDGHVLYANRIAQVAVGITEGTNVLDELHRILDDATAARATGEIAACVEHSGRWAGELTMQTAEGAIPVAVTIQRHDAEDDSDGIVSVIAHDISELKSVQAKLEHQATHDPLTGLHNRALFQELGDQALARANRRGTTVAVLFVDLDRFKPVNDSLGHGAGDALLVEVAKRLRASVRRGDVVARFGGDEFVILCEHPAGQQEMCELAERLSTALCQPFVVDGAEIEVGASVGIAVGGGARVTIDTLIRDADIALYQAKERGRGRAVVFGD